MCYLLRFYLVLIVILYSALLHGQTSVQDSLFNEGLVLFRQHKYESSINTFKANLLILEAQKNANKDKQELIARSYRNIGLCYSQLSQYEKAGVNLDIAIDKYQNVLSDPNATRSDTARLGSALRYRTIIMKDLGEYEKAISYAEEAQQKFIDIQDVRNEIRIGHLLEEIYFRLQNFEKVESIAIQNIRKYHDEEVNDPNLLSRLYTILANAYTEQGKYNQAIKNHSKALKFTTLTLDSARTYNNLGIVYTKTKEYKTAEATLDKALNIKKIIHKNTYHFTYVFTLENFGDLNIAQNNFKIALNYYQFALINLTDNFRDTTINNNPTVADNHYIYNKPDLLRVLDLKAQAALKAKKIDLAHATYQELDNWINEFYKDLSTNESKLTWIARAHAMYTHAIEVALEKGDKEKAFEYCEKARAVLLWQSHSQQAALNLLDDDKREEYDNLLAQIRQADHKYRDAAEEEKDELKRELDRSKQGFDQFEKTLSDSIPEYAQRKYQPDIIKVEDVQKGILNDTTALVEYHWSADDMLYIFTLTKKDIHIDKVAIGSDFDGLLQRFSEAIKNESNEPQDFTTPAYAIYQKIFSSAKKHFDEKIKKIIILPDGNLNSIPFEALTTEISQEWDSLPFLVQDYTFNYLYSCSIYRSSSLADTIQTALYIAPEFGKKDKHASLNKTEIEEKLKQLGLTLTSLTNTQPTHNKVISGMQNTDIIHFHSHAEQGAKADGTIYLYGGDFIRQSEIQEMELKARHVALGACETGTGKLNKGEGVLSLGWSFVYRGVPSVVMSLWKVNDESTSDLMENYYGYLDKEMPGDEALHEAKLDLIRNGKETHKHPYHWAAFIHTGNPPTQQFNPNTHKYFLIIGGFLLLSLLFYGLRRTKKHQK